MSAIQPEERESTELETPENGQENGQTPNFIEAYEEKREELLKQLNEHHRVMKNRKTPYKRWFLFKFHENRETVK